MFRAVYAFRLEPSVDEDYLSTCRKEGVLGMLSRSQVDPLDRLLSLPFLLSEEFLKKSKGSLQVLILI